VVKKELSMKDEKVADVIERDPSPHGEEDHRAPGTFVLTLILLLSFAVYYFANWKALADVWHVR
jgi:cytochrome c oxidase subunit I